MNEQIREMPFPFQGLDDTPRLDEMYPDKTPIAVNVRTFEALEERARGGSRPGISRYFNDSTGGPIQHMNTVVRADANAVGFAFNGVEYGNFGPYGGIDFGPFPPFTFPAPPVIDLGGGYPLAHTTFTITLRPVSQKGPADGSSRSLIATVRDQFGNPQAFVNVTLHTSPAHRGGDAVVQPTIFDLSDPPHGSTEFLVTNVQVETVTYRATAEIIPGQVFASNVAKIAWKPFKLTVIPSSPTSPIGSNVTLTGTLLDLNNNPAPGRTISLAVTGSGTGNGDTQVTDGSGQVSFTVTDSVPEAVSYTMTEVATDSEADVVTVLYGGNIAFVQVNSNIFDVNTPGGVKNIAFTSPVTKDSLLLLFGDPETTGFGISSVTDSQGNSYTKVLTPSGFAIWWAIAGSSSACTVSITYAVAAGTLISAVAIANYTGNATAGPVTGNNGKAEVNTTWSTDTINVIAANSAIMGAFHASRIVGVDPPLPTLTAGAGITERLQTTHSVVVGGTTFEQKIAWYDKIGVGVSAPVTATSSANKLYQSAGISVKV